MPYQRKKSIPYGERVAVSPQVAAELVGLHPKRVYAAIRAGELRAFRKGVRFVVLVSDLPGWIERTFKPVPPQPKDQTP